MVKYCQIFMYFINQCSSFMPLVDCLACFNCCIMGNFLARFYCKNFTHVRADCCADRRFERRKTPRHADLYHLGGFAR